MRMGETLQNPGTDSLLRRDMSLEQVKRYIEGR
jgi:hypothetical protein